MRNLKIANIMSWALVLTLAMSVMAYGEYEIKWFTIDGGGGVSSGGPYTLSGTIGQHDAGVASGGSFDLVGGFWADLPSCTVDLNDLAIFVSQWLGNGSANLDGMGDVDLVDFSILASYWLDKCPTNWPLK